MYIRGMFVMAIHLCTLPKRQVLTWMHEFTSKTKLARLSSLLDMHAMHVHISQGKTSKIVIHLQLLHCNEYCNTIETCI